MSSGDSLSKAGMRRHVDSGPPAPDPDTLTQVARRIASTERAMRTALAEPDKLIPLPLEIGDRIRLRDMVLEAACKLTIFVCRSGSRRCPRQFAQAPRRERGRSCMSGSRIC